MASQINPLLIQNPALAKEVVKSQNEIEKLKIERGALGLLWGTTSSIPNNVAAFLIVILLITGMGYSICVAKIPADKLNLTIKDFWLLITPLITLALGYLFGDKKRQRSVNAT